MRLRSTKAPWKSGKHFGEKDGRWKRFVDSKRARVARHYQREATKPVVSRFVVVAGFALLVGRLKATLRAILQGDRTRRYR